MKEGRKPEYPEKTPGDELQNSKEEAVSLVWFFFVFWIKLDSAVNNVHDLTRFAIM